MLQQLLAGNPRSMEAEMKLNHLIVPTRLPMLMDLVTCYGNLVAAWSECKLADIDEDVCLAYHRQLKEINKWSSEIVRLATAMALNDWNQEFARSNNVG